MNRGIVRVAAAVLVCLGAAWSPGAARAESTPVVPSDGSVSASTPRQIVIALSGVPEGNVTVTLTTASGRQIEFTGQPGVVGSAEFVAFPPTLESGTYVVRWSYATRSGSREGVSSFSVGMQSHVVDGTGERPSGGNLALMLAMLVAVVAAGGLMAFDWLGRRRTSAGLSVGIALAGVAAGASAAGSPLVQGLSLAMIATAIATIAFTTWGGALTTAGLAGAAIGLAAVSGGSFSWAATPLGAVGGASAGLLLSLLSAACIAPRAAARQVFRRWRVLAGVVMLSPLLIVAVGVSRHEPGVTVPAVLLLAGVLLLAACVPAAAWLVAAARNRGGTARMGALIAVCLVAASGLAAVGRPGDAVVTPLAEAARAVATDCVSGKDRLEATRCLQGLYGSVARGEGVTVALKGLTAEMSANPELRFYCHETAHAIGRASLAVNGTVDRAFADGFDVCDFGYYHGIVEGAAAGMNDDEFKAAIPGLCRGLASVNDLFYQQCNHGLGHAAARRANNDLVRGLEFCDALDSPESGLDFGRLESANEACGTGVTMEWFSTASAVGGADGNAVLPAVSSLRDACNAVPVKWKGSCVNYVGNTLDTGRPAESLAEISLWCLTQAPVEKECAEGVGRAAAGVGVDPADAIESCSSAPATKDACISYFIMTVATTVDYDAAAVDRICAFLPASYRDGAGSKCALLRQAAVGILATGDGKQVQ